MSLSNAYFFNVSHWRRCDIETRASVNAEHVSQTIFFCYPLGYRSNVSICFFLRALSLSIHFLIVFNDYIVYTIGGLVGRLSLFIHLSRECRRRPFHSAFKSVNDSSTIRHRCRSLWHRWLLQIINNKYNYYYDCRRLASYFNGYGFIVATLRQLLSQRHHRDREMKNKHKNLHLNSAQVTTYGIVIVIDVDE